MDADRLTALAERGTRSEVAGNSPLSLDDPDRVWLVRAGRLDVFAVPILAAGLTGARHHLFRATVGSLLCGIAVGPEARPHLLAVGGPDCEVVQLRRDQLLGLEQAELAALLASWIYGLTDGIVLRRIVGQAALLEPGLLQLAAEQSARANHSIVWARHVSGASRFLGKAELPLTVEDGFFPFAGTGWLSADASGASLEVMALDELLPNDAWSMPLARYHRMVLDCTAVNLIETDQRDNVRLKERARSQSRLVKTTLARLAHAVEPGVDQEDEDGHDDDLLVACRLVCDRLGVAVRPPPAVSTSRQQCDPVVAIARASRVRCRRVALKGDWWRQENGPLLAFQAANDRPVALLPTTASRYSLVEPQNQASSPVTAAQAALLRPFAYTFYRPFPAKALTTWELFRFAIQGGLRDWIALILFGLAGSFLGLFPPIVTGWIFDWIVPGAERMQLLLVICGLTASSLSVALFQLTRAIAVLRLQTRMESEVQAGMWDRLLDLPVTFFRRFTAGDLANRSLGVTTIRQLLTDIVLSTVFTLVFSLVSFGLLFYYDLRLALLASVIFAVVVLITGVAAVLQGRYQRRQYEVGGQIAGFVLQLVTGLSRIRVAGAEARALAIWAQKFSLQRRLTFRTRCVDNDLASFNAAAPLVSTMALFAAVSLYSRSNLSLGSFLAFSAAFGQLLSAALSVGGLVGSAVAVIPLHERTRPILETLPEANTAVPSLGDLAGDIEIGHVSFRYQADGPLILEDINLHIRPGEFVAFVGPSGAGKSTIIRLLLGFEKPTSGSIYYDRLDLAGLDVQAVRRQMGVVLQDGKIMAGDIFTNISGSSRLTLEEAWNAATASGLDEEIKNMPQGMFTVISEGGSTLSGGQRQRLLIARAIVAKPIMFLFDEATSALDNETQAKISRSLAQLKATRIVVAHRLSTIVGADRIYVIDRGRVVQTGTYQQLMQQGGLFAELAQRQLV